MARRGGMTSWRCAADGCREAVHYGYDTQREYREMYARQVKDPWLCTRHRTPEKVLSPVNVERRTVLVATPRYHDGLRGKRELLGMFWIEEGAPSGSGFSFGPGFNAHADDFPEGTRLIVTATIELPPSAEAEATP